MSIPANPERDSDLLLSDALTRATALLAEVSGLRATVARVGQRIWALGESIHGDEGVEHNEGCEGEPDCLACILADLRAVLDGPVTSTEPRARADALAAEAGGE